MVPGRAGGRLRLWGDAPAGRRGWLEWVGVLLVSAILAAGLIQTGALTHADNIVRDAFMGLRRHAPDDRIVIVAIDNRSLEALGRWPWPRETHARLIDRLTADQAGAIGFDVLFTEPDAAGDPALVAALTRSRRVCLPMAVDPAGANGAGWGELRPLPDLAAEAAGLGQVNLAADDDGVVRRAPLFIRTPDQIWDHLVVCALRTAGLPSPPRPASPSSDGRQGPLDVTPVELAFPGQGAFRTVSYVDVLRGEVPSALMTGKLVLVGMTADGQGDRYAVSAPRGALLPGVEIQAVLADTLLTNRAFATVPQWAVSGAAVVVLFLLMLAFLTLSPRWGLGVAAGLVVATLAAALGLFFANVWFPPLGVVAGLVIACPLWSWRRLAATSAYLDSELRQFMADAPMTARASRPASDDVIAHQVAAMREALGRLRGMNRFISDTLENLPDAALVVDAADVVVYANQRARDLFGEAEVIGADIAQRLAAMHPDLAAAAAADGGEVAMPDGRSLRLDAAPLADGDGERRIVRLADVTALRAAERQREEALQLLSHDMRAPQAAILTLLDGDHDRTDPRFGARIGDYARLTLNLADNYVQLARAEMGPLNVERLDLREVVIDALDILWPAANARQVKMVLADGEDIEIDGDRVLLTRALMNLLDNALKYSPHGSAVPVSVVRAGACVRIAVSDSGPGLDAEAFARFLKPFQHGSDGQAGTGLGLAFVNRVATRHGGSLTLGAAGPGAEMILTLPLPKG